MVDENYASSCHVYATKALELTTTEWEKLGLDGESDAELGDDQLLDSLVERVTALLLIRVLAVVMKENQDSGDEMTMLFPDWSTNTISRTVLLDADKSSWSDYHAAMTPEVIEQLRSYVRTILSGYESTPYHCSEHAFHVILSMNKFIDMILQTDPRKVKTYGLRNDTLAHCAMLFAALIHDVEHRGVPNRQLQKEHDPLAILYNDQSIAEQRSLHIGFSTLLQPKYKLLCTIMFGDGDEVSLDSDAYWYFRKIVINLVMNTDIASPERTQLSKSKFKEAFGETFESMESKLKYQLNSRSIDEDEVSLSDSVSENPSDNGVAPEDVSNLSPSSIKQPTKDCTVDSDSNLRSKADVFKNSDKIDYGYQKLLSPSFRSGTNRKLRVNSVACAGRRASVEMLQSDEVFAAKFQRRLSSMQQPAVKGNNFRKRLGIRRSMDLSGETLELYRSSVHNQRNRSIKVDMDESDELKAAVIMETIMTAADVAHNLQGWDQMVIWSGRLYFELRKAFIMGRGGDPQGRWFENQIGFLESYLLPLARRLEDTGVFGEAMGQRFAQIVESNRDTWLVEGSEVSEEIIVTASKSFSAENNE